MCSPNTLKWFEQHLTEMEIAEKRILDVGAYDVNGSLSTVIRPLQPSEYIGVDMRFGPGVDVVCRAEDLVETFGKHSFDIVVSSSMLEHAHDWRTAVVNMKSVCKPGGLMLITVPSHCPFHAYPHDYWRFSIEDIKHIFNDCHIMILDEDKSEWAQVYVKIQMPMQLSSQDLTHYPLYSIVTGRKTEEISHRDYFTPYFAQTIWKTIIHPKILWSWIVVKMGIKIRLIAPLKHLMRSL